ncbi:MotE family protein [Phyllobacterium myrsinacearum]|uniref:Flagellar motility protein MotE (MotC chaperone) n=1 Tax=Phyllobacterium myrsinacearum TaxID=28101 RepID=A0A839EII2_9HYPH|nr:MotE family protein [Phyllobacterium myrsinacearum]MBA8879801.1 flagellar motility protein MotE (MotC chaperone) [Phyllobacterium myrsinacearum]
MTIRQRFAAALVCALAISAVPSFGWAQDVAPKDETGQEIDRYCTNITDKAADARYAMQTRELEQLRVDIDSRIQELEAKRKEYEVWLKRRDEFIDKAEDSLVGIISKMRPDAAAAQMALMGDEPAAALLLKLNPRISSVILNEMPAEKSSRLARVIVGSRVVTTKERTAQ